MHLICMETFRYIFAVCDPQSSFFSSWFPLPSFLLLGVLPTRPYTPVRGQRPRKPRVIIARPARPVWYLLTPVSTIHPPTLPFPHPLPHCQLLSLSAVPLTRHDALNPMMKMLRMIEYCSSPQTCIIASTKPTGPSHLPSLPYWWRGERVKVMFFHLYSTHPAFHPPSITLAACWGEGYVVVGESDGLLQALYLLWYLRWWTGDEQKGLLGDGNSLIHILQRSLPSRGSTCRDVGRPSAETSLSSFLFPTSSKSTCVCVSHAFVRY